MLFSLILVSYHAVSILVIAIKIYHIILNLSSSITRHSNVIKRIFGTDEFVPPQNLVS